MMGYFICECASLGEEEIIPHEYDDEFIQLHTSSKRQNWEAFIILKTCPTFESVKSRMIDSTRHLALIVKEKK
jgi:hypothetical protein